MFGKEMGLLFGIQAGRGKAGQLPSATTRSLFSIQPSTWIRE